MDPDLRHDLLGCETDIEGALLRLSKNETLYLSCLTLFLDDPTTNNLGTAIRARAWDDAFTAAHALKGLAGNMGFVPLFHAAAELVILIRAGRIDEVDRSYREIQNCYQIITAAVRKNLPCANGLKGETL